MVIRTERHSESSGELGTGARTASEHPQFDVGILAGTGVQFDAVAGSVGTVQERAYVVDLLLEIGRLRARKRQCLERRLQSR